MIKRLLCLALMCAALGGCQHYMIHDPSTGKTYYTQQINRKGSGAVEFEDGRTGDTVTLQNSEVSKITAQQYKSSIHGTDQ